MEIKKQIEEGHWLPGDVVGMNAMQDSGKK
jgi:hypothetical protein